MSFLWTGTPLEIDPKDPFANDVLGRAAEAANLTSILDSTPSSFVLAVTAPWGAGKTTFLRMWQAELRDAGHRTLFFDAWKHDFLADPLVALVGELDEEMRSDGEPDARVKKALTNLKALAVGAGKRAVPIVLKVGSAGLIDLADLPNLVSEFGEEFTQSLATEAREQLASFTAAKRSMEGFREHLEKLAEEVAGGEDSNEPARLVFFVDELDRCRPDFAVSTLERIKHFFDVPGVVFVLGLDVDQLAASVKALYGNEFEARGYLRRFMDLEYSLNTPEGSAAIRHVVGQSGMAVDDDIVRTLSSVFGQQPKFTFRALQKTVSRLRLARTVGERRIQGPYLELLTLLSAVRVLDPELYGEWVSDGVRAERLLAWLGPPHEYSSIEPVLYGLSPDESEYRDYVAELEDDLGDEGRAAGAMSLDLSVAKRVRSDAGGWSALSTGRLNLRTGSFLLGSSY